MNKKDTLTIDTIIRFPSDYPEHGTTSFTDVEEWKQYILSKKRFISKAALMEKTGLSSPTINKNIRSHVHYLSTEQSGRRGEGSVFYDLDELEDFFRKNAVCRRRSININLFDYPEIISDKLITQIEEFLNLNIKRNSTAYTKKELNSSQRKEKERYNELYANLRKNFLPFFNAHCYPFARTESDRPIKLYQNSELTLCKYDGLFLGDSPLHGKEYFTNLIEEKRGSQSLRSEIIDQLAFEEGMIEVSLFGLSTKAVGNKTYTKATSRRFLQDSPREMRHPDTEKKEFFVRVSYSNWCDFYEDATGRPFDNRLSSYPSSQKADTLIYDSFLPASKSAVVYDFNALPAYKDVLDGALKYNKHRMFITGPAGTGKTALITKIVEEAKKAGKTLLVCAATGTAASNINDAFEKAGIDISCTTVHRAFHISNQMPIPFNPQGVKDIENLKSVLLSDIIIIDEISMLRMDVFSFVMNTIRNAEIYHLHKLQNNPSSGRLKTIQVILAGDFFQLPPVITDENQKQLINSGWPKQWVEKGGYAFFTNEWHEAKFQRYTLDHYFRQENDEGFRNMLEILRYGQFSHQDELRMLGSWLHERFLSGQSSSSPDNIIHIFDRRIKAEKQNENMLRRLSGRAKVYPLENPSGTKLKQKQLRELNIINTLKLKVGALVLATKNDPENRFFNGQQGIIKELKNDSIVVRFRGHSEDVEIERFTYNLTSDLWEFNDNAKSWSVKRTIEASAKQFPLALAYAITVHKSQGMTFDAAYINPRSWAYGQLYTALSRIRTEKGIYFEEEVLNEYIITSPEVYSFYKNSNFRLESEECADVAGPSLDDVMKTIKFHADAYIEIEQKLKCIETKGISNKEEEGKNLRTRLEIIHKKIADNVIELYRKKNS